MQFVGEEIERFDAATGGSSVGYFVPDNQLHGTGQPNEPIDWNTPGDRHWYLDALSDQMPDLVSGQCDASVRVHGGRTRGADTTVPSPAANPAGGQTMMVDGPSSPVRYVHDAFARSTRAGSWGSAVARRVKRVEHRVRFHEYLVRANQVLYENTMLVTYTYTSDPGASGTAPAPTNKSGTGAVASAIRDEHFRALLRRFPAWGFYPH